MIVRLALFLSLLTLAGCWEKIEAEPPPRVPEAARGERVRQLEAELARLKGGAPDTTARRE